MCAGVNIFMMIVGNLIGYSVGIGGTTAILQKMFEEGGTGNVWTHPQLDGLTRTSATGTAANRIEQKRLITETIQNENSLEVH